MKLYEDQLQVTTLHRSYSVFVHYVRSVFVVTALNSECEHAEYQASAHYCVCVCVFYIGSFIIAH